VTDKLPGIRLRILGAGGNSRLRRRRAAGTVVANYDEEQEKCR
jgi:hypothetical protein